MDLKTTGRGGMDWIHLAQDGDQLKIVTNAIINFRNPCVAERRAAPQRGLSSIASV
jgi:hypothetical protein